MKQNSKGSTKPMVSICTPTFNRRPFIPMIIKCFQHQTYPKDKIEWIIIDDGTDKIEDLFAGIPQVKYFKYDDKMTLGAKRNLMNEKASGDIIVYMDDDDYYPPERVEHAVESLLNNPNALCAGSSIVYIYFKHIGKMVQFGPYGPNHATAATFAFKKELLKITRFDEKSCVAEETNFLKGYTIPFVQLDPKKSILVFSHEQNSFDKKELLAQGFNNRMQESPLVPADFIKEQDILDFFFKDMNNLVLYEPGKVENKPDVVKQIAEIKQSREKMMQEQMKTQAEYNEILNKLPPPLLNQIKQMQNTIQQLTTDNQLLVGRAKYFEDKLNQLISERVKEKMKEKMKEK